MRLLKCNIGSGVLPPRLLPFEAASSSGEVFSSLGPPFWPSHDGRGGLQLMLSFERPLPIGSAGKGIDGKRRYERDSEAKIVR